MKLLIITNLIPHPLSDGGRISQFAFLSYVRHKHAVTLVVFMYTDADERSVQHLQQIWPEVRIKAISMRRLQPVPTRRTIRRLFKSACDAILHKANIAYGKLFVVPQDARRTTEIRLTALANFLEPKEKNIIDQVVTLVKETKPDLVQMEFVETLDLSFCIPQNIPKIFVHHELRSVRVKTEYTASVNEFDIFGGYLNRFCEKLEISLLESFDGIITVSEDDKRFLLQYMPQKNICSSPFPILDNEFREISLQEPRFEKLVFVGGEFHTPNKDAVEWYISSMAGEIYEKFGFVLHVIGNWSEETVIRYKDNPTVIFSGYIDDVGDYCQNSIMIVPLRIGSGIRQKILYAAAWGIPIISTTLGSEGIPEREKVCLKADIPVEFVRKIDELIQMRERNYEWTSKAQRTVRKHFSQRTAGEQRLSFYESVIEHQRDKVERELATKVN